MNSYLKILLLDLGTPRDEFNEPIGIECIANYLKNKTDNLYIDLDSYDMYEVYDKSKIPQYDILGISINIGTLDRFDDIYKFIKVNNLKIPIIVGNAIPTFAYKELISLYDDIVCIRGEGEEAFLKIVEIYKNTGAISKENLAGVSNIAFKNIGDIFCSKMHTLDLSEIDVTARDSVFINYIKNNNGIMRVEGSRGCHWGKCNFCCINSKYGEGFWRGYGLKKILNELIVLSSNGINSPYFSDEDFFGQQYDRIDVLSTQIIESKIQGIISSNMNFFISILAADVVNDKGFETIKKLKQAGLREVFIGIESGEQNQIKRYQKKANVDINIIALEKLKNINLQVDIGFILFDPFLKYEELCKNLSYLETIKLNDYDSRSIKRLRVQPLTSVAHKYKDVLVGGLDINNLEYPYRFIDKKVEYVYNLYSEWETKYSGEVYRIQALSRGEVESEEKRERTKKLLSIVRDNDFDVLKNIAYYIEGSITDIGYRNRMDNSLKQKESVLESFLKLY